MPLTHCRILTIIEGFLRKGATRATKMINGFSELMYETRFLKIGINHTRNEKVER